MIYAALRIDGILGDKTLAELAKQHGDHPSQIFDWKTQLLEHAAGVFGSEVPVEPKADLKELHAKIGRLALENDFLAGALDKVGLSSAKR